MSDFLDRLAARAIGGETHAGAALAVAVRAAAARADHAVGRGWRGVAQRASRQDVRSVAVTASGRAGAVAAVPSSRYGEIPRASAPDATRRQSRRRQQRIAAGIARRSQPAPVTSAASRRRQTVERSAEPLRRTIRRKSRAAARCSRGRRASQRISLKRNRAPVAGSLCPHRSRCSPAPRASSDARRPRASASAMRRARRAGRAPERGEPASRSCTSASADSKYAQHRLRRRHRVVATARSRAASTTTCASAATRRRHEQCAGDRRDHPHAAQPAAGADAGAGHGAERSGGDPAAAGHRAQGHQQGAAQPVPVPGGRQCGLAQPRHARPGAPRRNRAAARWR